MIGDPYTQQFVQVGFDRLVKLTGIQSKDEVSWELFPRPGMDIQSFVTWILLHVSSVSLVSSKRSFNVILRSSKQLSSWTDDGYSKGRQSNPSKYIS